MSDFIAFYIKAKKNPIVYHKNCISYSNYTNTITLINYNAGYLKILGHGEASTNLKAAGSKGLMITHP
jgi:hypothetical protein